MSLAYATFRCSHLPFWPEGSRRHSPQQVGLYFSILPWARWRRGAHTSTVWEGPRDPLSLGCELISLTATEPSMSSTRFALGLINTVYSFPGFCIAGYQLPKAFTSPSGQMWPETVSSVGGAMTAPCQCMGKQGSKLGKIPPLEIWSRQICILMSSLVRTYHQVGSAHEQTHLLGLLFGHRRYRLGLPRSMCWLLPAPTSLFCHSQIPSGWAL